VHAIVPRLPVGENPIRHGRFVGRLRRIIGLRGSSEICSGRKDEEFHRDSGQSLQATKWHGGLPNWENRDSGGTRH
jgi:hypothetical protein